MLLALPEAVGVPSPADGLGPPELKPCKDGPELPDGWAIRTPLPGSCVPMPRWPLTPPCEDIPPICAPPPYSGPGRSPWLSLLTLFKVLIVLASISPGGPGTPSCAALPPRPIIGLPEPFAHRGIGALGVAVAEPWGVPWLLPSGLPARLFDAGPLAARPIGAETLAGGAVAASGVAARELATGAIAAQPEPTFCPSLVACVSWASSATSASPRPNCQPLWSF
mmetsp:Transcript_55019/g.139799  ORF Transcript_55019/g.139799 Transcript_55019/m.139799 type:complete len:223 (-) Transcript_55019:1648-2316(-)